MAKYRLEALLSARKAKEDRAAREARAAAFAVAEAKKKAEAAREELGRYRLWRPEEEERRFAAIREQVLSQTELDRFRYDLEALRARESELEETAEAAERAVDEAEQEERKAKQRLVAAAKDREKIEEHRERWLREELKRQEAAEEKEMEDFSGHGSPDDEEAELVLREDAPWR